MRTRNTGTTKKAGAAPVSKKGGKTSVKAVAEPQAEADSAEPISVAKSESGVKPETTQSAQDTKQVDIKVESKMDSSSIAKDGDDIKVDTETAIDGDAKKDRDTAVTIEKPKEPVKKTPKKKATPKKEAVSYSSEKEPNIERKEDVKTAATKENEPVKAYVFVKVEEVKVEPAEKDSKDVDAMKAKEDLPTEMEVVDLSNDEVLEEKVEQFGDEEIEGEGEEGAGGEEYIEEENLKDEGDVEVEDEDDDGEELNEETQAHELRPVTERQKRKKLEIFVGGLDRDATEEDLKKVFEQVGEVVEVRLMKNSETGKNKGYAFIRFASADQAKRAVTELARPQVRGKPCGVTASDDNDTLFIGNINKSWKSEQVLEKLKEYSVEGIEEMTLMEDPQNEGMNRGFAFLELATHNDAIQAFKRLQLPDAIFGSDRSGKIEWAKPLNEPDEEIMARVKSVFVDGMPANWTDDKVKQHFGKYGEIERIVMARNMLSARRKDFGFVNFALREGAVACIEAFKNIEYITDGEDKVKVKVELSKPQPRGKAGKGGLRGGRGRGTGFSFGIGLVPRRPFRGGRGLARGGGREGRHFYDESSGHQLLRALRQHAEESMPPPVERFRGRRPSGSIPFRPSRGYARGQYTRGNRFNKASEEYGARRITPPRRGPYRDDYPPRGGRAYPGMMRGRSSHPGRHPLPPRDDGYSRRDERGHGYGRNDDGYGSVVQDYGEAGPGMKRHFTAMDDDPSYFEPGTRGYPRARIDYADNVPLGDGSSQYADPARDLLPGRSSHGLGVGGGRAAMPPLGPPSSLSIYDSGAGFSGGSGSMYGSSYGVSDFIPNAADVRGSALQSSSLYGGRSGSGGYNLPDGSGTYY